MKGSTAVKVFSNKPRMIYRWNIAIICELIRRVLEQKFDCFIIIEGRRGLGKSTLAYVLCNRLLNGREIAGRQRGEWAFKPNRDIIYSQNDFLKAINHKWKGIVFADEMVATAFNRDFFSESQKKIIKAINMNRDHQNLIIACIPQFAVLDNQIKNLCRIRITVLKRGFAIIHTPNKTIYTRDIWDSATNEKIERSWMAGNGAIRPKYSRLTTFRGVFKFPDLTPNQREIYEQIKVNKRNIILIEEEQKALDEKGSEENKNWIKELKQRLELGEFKTIQEFNSACIVANKKPSRIRTQINLMFSDENKPYRVSNLCSKSPKGADMNFDDADKKNLFATDVPDILR